ncbi:MAG: TIGR01777 family oxidoreductase [Deltaproteobacteria bacterium]|nr:TIGR01777 family oxidoreductase [Deltaproteobacteria bacterium]
MSDRHVVLTGATGLIGGALATRLVERGDKVTALARDPQRAKRALPSGAGAAEWDLYRPDAGDWRQALADADAVVHLAGTPLFAKRWSAKVKADLRASRVRSTEQLVGALGEHRPRVFVSASAAGYYGTDPGLTADERTAPADDFLAGICVDWEAASAPLRAQGVRVAPVRIGIALSKRGGALKELLPLFRFGMGGVFGDPAPWLNWIHLDDLVSVFLRALDDETLDGPINGVSQAPVRNADFDRAVAAAMGRHALLRYPTPLLRLGLGEAANYLSGGARVISRYDQPLRFPELGAALADVLR